jgi:hypothetical protein
VARNAKNATTIAEGTLDVSPPALELTMFGPNRASKSTASQMTLIAREAPA